MNPLIAGREEIKHDPAFQRLKRHVIEATGLAFYADKDDELAAHVSHRIDSLQVPDYDAYLQRLLDERPGDAELGLLANLLTIGETFFFRHQELFDALAARVIPELIERNWREHRLRIWSAGCAIGAEPYSLAIVLRRNFAAQLADWEIEIGRLCPKRNGARSASGRCVAHLTASATIASWPQVRIGRFAMSTART